ncbi:9800_t:CDS:2, partial [Racocetra fulgida]
ELAITQFSQSIPGTPSPRKIPLPTSPASPTPRRIPLPTNSDNEDSDATVSDVDEEKEIAVPDSTNRAEIHDIHDVSLGSSKRTSNLNASGSSEDNEIHQFNLKTLSLLEYMLRLSALEVCEQTNHLEIADEKINLFLKDDDSTGSSSTSTVSATTPESTPSKATP